MKKCINIFVLISLSLVSCTKYLDIVPDNIVTVDHAFSDRANAEKLLHTCYSYLPKMHSPMFGPGISSDELTMLNINVINHNVYGRYVAQGFQYAADPYNDFWCGRYSATPLYEGIRYCNLLIENVDKVPDMDDEEKMRWKDEGIFMKAYYHFLLTRQYGPIPIVDSYVDIGASSDEVHVYRNTVDECFEYIVRLLDTILQDEGLPDTIDLEVSEHGRVTSAIVKAFKAQVLVYAASPLFNGNTDYKGYTDNRGIDIFCTGKTDKERLARWESAASACREAVETLEQLGFGLYSYDSNEYSISQVTRYFLTRRGSLTVPNSNPENIWCYTNDAFMQLYAFPRNFTGGTTLGTTSVVGMGILGVPIEVLSLYYTNHGLPIENDLSWKDVDPFSFRKATAEEKLYIKPDYTTIQLHFDRENRFYADLAFDGASWIGNGATKEATTYFLPRATQLNQYTSPTISNNTATYCRKLINYKTVCSSAFTTSPYYFPILSMREMYLYYAESLNEAGADWSEVVPILNLIRRRSGVPDVEDSWDNYSDAPGKYKTQEGLREIIHREQTIELMFEGHRCWDQRRWKEARESFNHAISGWAYWESSDEAFFTPQVIQQQVFTIRDYLWPINNNEIYRNPNLIQNPGW